MTWMAVVVAAITAAEPCEAPRVRDTAPLVAAMAQDKVLGLAFTKAAGVCQERGDACDQARLECTTLLNQTIQKQVGFDEGQWLRDMLLPYNGANYPLTRQFGAATLAADASCNVEPAALEQAAQRRQAQAARRDAIFQEYQLYTRWAQAQLQRCKERAAADEVKNAQARAESERLAAAAAAVAAAEQLKQKQAQEAAAAKAEAERKAREAAEAEARKEREAKEAAEREARERKEAEQRAREEREQEKREAEARAEKVEEERKKEREEAEAQRRREKEEAERQQKEAEEKRVVTERDTRVAQLRQQKARLVSDAEANLKTAREQEALKKQLAVDAVASSPAIAAAAVAEAAEAEKARVAAEKALADAQQKADAIVIEDSHERSAGSVFLTGGGSMTDVGFGLGVLGGAHFGFWGTAPAEGMASGLELRLWARYLATFGMPASQNFDSLLTLRYFFGRLAVGVAGELRLLDPSLSTLRGGAGPAVGVAIIDTRETRVLLGINYLPVGNTMDALRFAGELEVSWRFLSFQVHGGSFSKAGGALGWQIGGTLGVRASW